MKPAQLPLRQIKVLDFSTLLPGPYATMLLADMGAEIKSINAINREDLVKTIKPLYGDSSYAYLSLHRHKKSMALDLKIPAAIETVKALLAEYDVLVEQFRPGVMAKLGLDYASLSAFNPKLIYCSITGYGQYGDNKSKAGHDINYLALSGLASFSGTKATGPVLSGCQIADIAGGSHHAVMAILAAIIERGISGKGQHLDISMTDAAFALTGIYGAGAVGAGVDPQLGKTQLNGGSFYDYYQTQDERYLSVGALEPKFAAVFFQAIGHSDWLSRVIAIENSSDKNNGLDSDMDNGINKEKLVQQLKQDIADVIARQPLSYWQSLFAPLDACVEPVLTVTEAAKSPLMTRRNMVTEITLTNGEKVNQIAPAIKFSSANSNN